MMRMIFRGAGCVVGGGADGEGWEELAGIPADAGFPARAAIIPSVADAVSPLLRTRDAPA